LSLWCTPLAAISFTPYINARGFPVEPLYCPEHFQERINQVAGFNRYDEPNYRLVWAQTETIQRGGAWEAVGDTFTGYRDVLLGDGLPHWMLVKWIEPGKSIDLPFLPAQGPASFYAENRDPKTGLCLLGEYPYHGSYQIALNLVAKWFENGRLRISAYPLDSEIVEMMIPVIQASMLLSAQAKLRYLKEVEERDEADIDRQIQDAYDDVKLSAAAKWSSWVQDKQRQIERSFHAATAMKFRNNPVFTSPVKI